MERKCKWLKICIDDSNGKDIRERKYRREKEQKWWWRGIKRILKKTKEKSNKWIMNINEILNY